jgi:Uma2 family endonuclease
MALAETTLAEATLPADAVLGVHPERRGPVQATEFERWPQEPDNPMELIGGWVVAMSPIGFSSGYATKKLTVLLDPAVEDRGWCLTVDTRHRSPRPAETVVFPDLAVHRVSAEALPRAGETVIRAPDLVIEILGEETAERDQAPLGAKFLAYEMCGVEEYFYTWPDGRAAAGFRLNNRVYEPLEADGEGFFPSRVLGARLRLVPAALAPLDGE